MNPSLRELVLRRTRPYFSSASPEQIDSLQKDLNTLYQWSQDWLILFNVNKCKVIHFRYSNTNHDYVIGGNVLAVADEERDLGVIVSKDLKVTKQCAKAVCSANRILGMTARFITNKTASIILKLYKSLVRPHLEYCIQAWRPHYRKDIELLEGVQRRATRMIEGYKNLDYTHRLQLLGLTTLETRRLRGDLIQTFKIVNSIDCLNMHDFFQISSTITRGHDLKSCKQRFLLDVGKFSFSNRVIDHWNDLPSDVIACNTLNSFKNKLDYYLVHNKGLI